MFTVASEGKGRRSLEMEIDDVVISRWLERRRLSRVDTPRRRPRRCLACREMGAHPDSGVHPGDCEVKLYNRLLEAWKVMRSPEQAPWRARRQVWATRIRANGRRIGRLSFRQFSDRWDHFGGKCWMCGGEGEVVDHVLPVSRGGTGWASNLRPACKSCKSRKQNKSPADFGGSLVAFLAWCRGLGSRDEIVLTMRRAGASLRAIGRELGLSQEGVRKVLVRSPRRSTATSAPSPSSGTTR